MKSIFFFIVLVSIQNACFAQEPGFKVIGFYSAKNDLAHISFINEANKWFSDAANAFCISSKLGLVP